MTWLPREDTDITIERSRLSIDVWVPVLPYGDYTCFLHAGRIRAVKAWVEAEWHRQQAETGVDLHNTRLIWLPVGRDEWALYFQTKETS